MADATSPQSSATQRRTTSTISNASSSTNTNIPAAQHASTSSLRLLLKLPAILTILLRVAIWPLIKVLNILFTPKEFDGVDNSVNADRAARAFVGMVRKQISVVRPVIANLDRAAAGDDNDVMEQYNEPSCPFVEKGYSSTMDEIAQNNTISNPHNPLLLIYLHSPLHSQGTKFIDNYLCHPQLLKLLNDNTENNVVKCFGASVHSADGQRLRDMMEVTSFPFMALLSVKSRSSSTNNNNSNNISMELLLRLESTQLFTIQPSQITTYLNTAITRHAQIIAEETARRLQREEDARLREEQNREYQEALLADQMREMERNEQLERERREREEAEERERLEMAKEQSRLEDAQRILDESGGEPPVGTKVGVARMRFTLPNGKKVDRRFRSVDTVEVLRAFLTLHLEETGVEIKNFGLSTSFPKKSFGEEDNKLTLEEAGLAPQAVVMVQDLDA
eukprot:CAMPEP_0201691206 /NCGR_PEP_ID=MMETSP0578-20130828/4428_1 /ASSEMBLY_ACC=CAM_ASM_000663 /TAXON_ID=267565 /ORGANISM="Skeletonema grethea, Strain CCMP 1804" /LENGTH=450 /DNA_ID=CAMNT_0048176365 /DNA_START=6 /DNA_END=1358 /DNA_ORIENTATION=-